MKKQLIYNTIVMYVRLLITLFISLYSSRIILKNLGIEDFGIYNLVGGVVALASFMTNTLRDAVQRFYSIEIGKNNITTLNIVYSTSIRLHSWMALIVLLILSIGFFFIPNYLKIPSESISEALWVYTFSILSMLVSIISIPFTSIITAYEKFNIIAIIGIVDAFAKLGVAFLIGVFISNRLIIYSGLLFTIILFSSLAYVIYSRKKFNWVKYTKRTEKKYVKDLCGFSLWNMFGSFANLFMSNGTNIIIGMFFSPIIVAARGISYQVMGAVRHFSSNFQAVLNPQIIKYYAQKKIDSFISLVFKGCRISFLLFFFICSPIAFYIGDILKLWLGEYPKYTEIFTILVLINALLESMTYPITTAVRATGNIKKYQIITSVLLILCVFCSYTCLCMGHKPTIVFINNIFFTSFVLVIRFILLKRLVDYQWKLVFKMFGRIIIVAVSIFIANLVILQFDINTILKIVLSYLTDVILLLLIGLEKSESKVIIKKIKYYGKE